MIFFFLLSIFFLLMGFIFFGYVQMFRKKNILQLEKRGEKVPSVAVLIPAKDESKVIESLLVSIENQTFSVPPESVYIIVESLEDKTVEIALSHHMSYFVRKKLHLKTKGYALAELIEDLNSKKKLYDCYFIFDADNILDNHFLENMLKDYQLGYAISTGYRSLKNADHYFPVSAGLTFYMVNEIRNRFALNNHGNLILSGTGYYIDGKYINKWKTFPFHSLTEDYESSLYYALEGISTHYREDAVFYDEQPKNYRQSIIQRSRWIKGYFSNWISYRPKLKQKEKEKPLNIGSLIEMRIGILPLIFIVLGLVLLLIGGLGSLGLHFGIKTILYFLLLVFLIYVALVFLTAILLWITSKKLTISKKVYFQTLFYHPLFLISYIHALFVAIIKRNLGWAKVEHGVDKKKNEIDKERRG